MTNISHEAIKSETMDGLEWDSDPTAHVLSANVHRRHLTKGQQAMAVALEFPDPEKGKRNDLLNDSTGLDFDKASLSRARFVLRHCRDKAEEVLRNAKYPLTVATVSIRWRIARVPGECCNAAVSRFCYATIAPKAAVFLRLDIQWTIDNALVCKWLFCNPIAPQSKGL